MQSKDRKSRRVSVSNGVPLGIFSALYVPSRLIVPGDAATTASNIMASESLFRPGLVSDLLAPLVLMLVVLVLYK